MNLGRLDPQLAAGLLASRDSPGESRCRFMGAEMFGPAADRPDRAIAFRLRQFMLMNLFELSLDKELAKRRCPGFMRAGARNPGPGKRRERAASLRDFGC